MAKMLANPQHQVITSKDAVKKAGGCKWPQVLNGNESWAKWGEKRLGEISKEDD